MVFQHTFDDICIAEDMSMSSDRQQIIVSTTGESVRVKRMTAGSRVVQFARSVTNLSSSTLTHKRKDSWSKGQVMKAIWYTFVSATQGKGAYSRNIKE